MARRGWAGENRKLFEHPAGGWSCYPGDTDHRNPRVQLSLLFFHFELFDQAGQVRALKLQAVCCSSLIAFRFVDCSFDDVAAMFFHRLMVWEGQIGEVFARRGAAYVI